MFGLTLAGLVLQVALGNPATAPLAMGLTPTVLPLMWFRASVHVEAPAPVMVGPAAPAAGN